jgi:hypothetical protein
MAVACSDQCVLVERLAESVQDPAAKAKLTKLVEDFKAGKPGTDAEGMASRLNKIVEEHAEVGLRLGRSPVATAPTKPPLPQAEADVRGVSRYSWQGHQNAAKAEKELAETVHSLPDQVVVRWGDPIGAHGADVISVNQRTGAVTLWDAKFRSGNVTIQPSPTFTRQPRRMNAVNEAIRNLQSNQTLPADIRRTAIDNLMNLQFQTRTVGFGNAKNSTLR